MRTANSLTAKKDLRGGRSLWTDSRNSGLRSRKLLGQEHCDVVVVGGGVSGALTAALLVQAGFDVVVVDRREPGHGSTIASTAMIQFDLDEPLAKLADLIGAAKAERAYVRSFRAVEALKDLINQLQIRAAWRDRDALYLTGPELGRTGMNREAIYRQKIGLPSRYIAGPLVKSNYGIDRTGAIVSQGSAELNPIQLTVNCLRNAMAKGCRVYSKQEIVAVDHASKGVRLTSKTGASINAKRAIFATGYETVKGLPSDGFEITSSWTIATKPIASSAFWPSRCLIWEAADPYLYLRTTSDDRVVVGGEDSGLTDPVRRDRASDAICAPAGPFEDASAGTRFRD